MDALGGRLRWLRKSRGITLMDLSEGTGVSVSFLSDIERGRTRPSLDTLGVLAQFYGVGVGVLLEPEPAREQTSGESEDGWDDFLRTQPDIEPDIADLLRQVGHRTKDRVQSVDDWTQLYYSLLTLLGRQRIGHAAENRARGKN